MVICLYIYIAISQVKYLYAISWQFRFLRPIICIVSLADEYIAYTGYKFYNMFVSISCALHENTSIL